MSRTHATSFAFALTVALAVASTLGATQAHAVQRTHVSAAFGSDANTATNCSAAAPCRFFAAAMTVTDTNGEVIVLDSGGYGAVTITKSLALIAPTGVYAGISVFPGADGVTIATPNVNVVLRGLSINGQGGNNGINMTAGNSLTVENCVISNLTQNGINVAGAINVNITDSIVRRNSGNGIFLRNGVTATITRAVVSGNTSTGIYMEGNVASATTTADIADSTIDGNLNGVDAFSAIATALVKVSVRDSRAVRNVTNGLIAQTRAGAAAAVILSASNNIVSNNAVGIGLINTGATVIASGNTVTNNAASGLINLGGVFESAGNNTVRRNGVNINGTITAVGTN
jgi:Right handed beta helix region